MNSYFHTFPYWPSFLGLLALALRQYCNEPAKSQCIVQCESIFLKDFKNSGIVVLVVWASGVPTSLFVYNKPRKSHHGILIFRRCIRHIKGQMRVSCSKQHPKSCCTKKLMRLPLCAPPTSSCYMSCSGSHSRQNMKPAFLFSLLPPTAIRHGSIRTLCISCT
jgi:hypothetical protein